MADQNAFGNSGVERFDPRTIGQGGETASGTTNEPTSGSAREPVGGEARDPRIDTPRKRGRPKGSKNRTQGNATQGARSAVPVDRDAISAILLSVHAMLAGIVKIPELALDKSEANSIADASAKVAALYDLTADVKVIAWTNLAMALGMVYGTRIVAIRERKKADHVKRQSKVVPINGMSPNVLGAVKLPDWDTSPIGPSKKN